MLWHDLPVYCGFAVFAEFCCIHAAVNQGRDVVGGTYNVFWNVLFCILKKLLCDFFVSKCQGLKC